MTMDKDEMPDLADEGIQFFLKNERRKRQLLTDNSDEREEGEPPNWSKYELNNMQITIPPSFNEIKLDEENTKKFNADICFYCEDTYLFIRCENDDFFTTKMKSAKKHFKAQDPRIVFLSQKHMEKNDVIYEYLFCKLKKRREYLWCAYGFVYKNAEGIAWELIVPFPKREKFEQLAEKIFSNVKLLEEKPQ